MSIPVHYVQLYQKPKQGSQFIARYKALAYQHKISAVGGFDTASFDIMPTNNRSDPQWFASMFLGNRIAVIVDDPFNPIFEGYINRVTFGAGSAAYTMSLDDMANRVTVKYATAGAEAEITPANNTESQSVYGIKQSTLDMGALTATGTNRTFIRDTVLANTAWPKTSRVGNTSGLIHIEANGFYHTLDWQEWHSTSVTVVTLYNRITAAAGLLPNLANGATFFDNTDFTDITNNTMSAANGDVSGKTIMDIMVDIQSSGDGTNYYVFGITPTSAITGKRRLYYRVANYAISYTIRRNDDMRLRDNYGKLVRPWVVRPDAGVRFADWSSLIKVVGDDPRETYITDITYVADTQSVSFSGDDDASIEGAFQLHRRLKSFNKKRFGANLYTL